VPTYGGKVPTFNQRLGAETPDFIAERTLLTFPTFLAVRFYGNEK
jgi:hypothetical protein